MTQELISNCNLEQLKAFEQIEFELFTKLDNLCGKQANSFIKKFVVDEPKANFICKIKDLIMRYPEDYIKNKIDKIEDDLFFIMREDGLIDGKKFNFKISQNKKASYIMPLISIPRDNFNLSYFIKNYAGDLNEIKGLLNGVI